MTLLKKLATETRQWAEDFAHNYPRYYSSDLDGLCAIASSYLSNLLEKNNIPHKIAIYEDDDSGHCFVICENKIVDITATQFIKYKLKPVEIRKLEDIDWYKYPIWNISLLVDNPTELLKHQKKTGWCLEHTIAIDKDLHNTLIPKKINYKR